jgi:DNA-binding response OmpR family regulator
VRDKHEISSAVDGKQGIKLLETVQFDLVITDVLMPEKDGLEVMMWLKNQAHRPKVIVMSGGGVAYDQKELLHMCKLMSADMVLPKPLNFATLQNTVRDMLKGS